MSESREDLFEKVKIDFTCIKSRNLISNGDDLILKKFGGSFDDQHDLTCKIKASKITFPRKHQTELLQKNKYGYPYSNTFLSAAYIGDIKKLQSLLDSGIDPNFCDSKGRTALHLTASKGHYEAAKLLLTSGSNCNMKDLNGNSALHLAVLANHIQMVTLLLKSGASVKEEDNNGRTPINLAKSRLTILQDCTSYNSDQLKQEAKNIIEMMQIYLTKCNKKEKLIFLNHFITRLNLHDTKEDVDNDLCDLLQSIDNLSLQ